MQIVLKILKSVAVKFIGTVTSVQVSEPAIALTFDDGPDPSTTPRILEVLERYGARGTFFMVGKRAASNPELVKRIANAGHAICNHSWSHVSLPTVSGRERREEIRACAKALGKYGHQSLASRLDAYLLGYTVVNWNLHVEDWSEISAEEMLDWLDREMKPGSIVLLHDSLYTAPPGQDRSRESVLQTLEQFLSKHAGAYRFVTVPELLKLGKANRRNWYDKGHPEWLASLEYEEL
jgi:peptidoglycan/xylan/chitin deacetylase (PgdA/CDA1 family)